MSAAGQEPTDAPPEPVATPTPTGTVASPTTTPQPTPSPTVTVPTATPTPTASPDRSPEPGTTTAPATPSPEPVPTLAPAPTTTTPATVVPWTREPAVTTSTLPGAVVLAAVLVLLATTVALVLLQRRARRAAGAPAVSAAPAAGVPSAAAGADVPTLPTHLPPPGADPTATLGFLLTIGEALTDASAPVVQVERTLERIAAVNGLPGVAVVALPTALVVSTPGGSTAHTVASSAGSRPLRLHQVADVLRVADAAEVGRIDPVEGAARIRLAVVAAPLYSAPARVLGYVASSAGLAMILGGGVVDVLVAAVLGAGVAGLQVAAGRMPAAYQALLVLLSAFLVSTAVFALSRTGLDLSPLPPLAAPLVTFLPGALLTTAAIDLATRQMIAGSARLAAGAMQLVLLALGITAAGALVGVPAATVGAETAHPLGWAGPWVGVLVYGCGVVLHNCAPRDALPWILLVLVVAYAGQLVGGLLLGGVPSAFVGAFAMTVVAMCAATRPTGPPTLVGFLPGFWLLVPGALSLVGVTSALAADSLALSTVVTAGSTMVTISLGVLTGIAVGSAVARRTGGRAPSW